MANAPIIIGAGHNGLTAAFHLAKAGLRPIVLERREQVGGGATTAEIHPGFRCPAFTHELLVHRDVVRAMDLDRHGLRLLDAEDIVCAPTPDGPPLVLSSSVERTVAGLRASSRADADAYPQWRAAVDAVTGVLMPLLAAPAPNIDHLEFADLSNLLGAGRRFRGLAKRDAFRVLRWLPMPIADLVREFFTQDLLCATLAGPAVSGTQLGPRSAGSALVMLLREAHRRVAGGQPLRVAGGPGALTTAMAAAARNAGADIRTGAAVERIVVRDNRVAGVVTGGHELTADVVLSSADPRSTFLGLIDASELMPSFRSRMSNYRSRGTLAKINLALSALPRFAGIEDRDSALLSGRIHIGPSIDYLERAFDHSKYGEVSSEPWLDVRLPSVLDPSLAPPGCHVASIYVHYAPYRLRSGDWNAARETLMRSALAVLDRYAPGVGSLIAGAEMLTPPDLERELGIAGGHPFHGEIAIDQLFAFRPSLGYAKYDSPIEGLYLCGAGTHPGGFMTGASGQLAARQVLKKIAAR